MAKETEWTKPIRERFTQYRNERPSIRSYGNAELDRMLDDAFVVIFVGCAVIEAQAERIENLVDTIRNARVTLQIMRLPKQDNTVASNEELMSILAESFKAALAEEKK